MNTNALQKVGTFLTKNSPTILTGISVAGLITTVVMAVKATPKAINILRQEEEARLDGFHDPNIAGVELTKKDIIKLTWKCYVPATIMGVITAGCIVGSNSVNLRRNAALAGLYSLSETTLKEYQAKVAEVIGENKHRQIKDDIAKDRIAKNPTNEKAIIITGKGETLCYEPISGRYFKSDIEQIRRTINEINRRMMNEMYVTLNEVYYELGLSDIQIGEDTVFHIDDGLLEIDFSTQMASDGSTPCLVLNFNNRPRYRYTD